MLRETAQAAIENERPRRQTGPMDPDLAIIESIYEALDEGRFEDALGQARETLEGLPADDPVLRFLAGIALRELDRPDQASVELRRAVELDPGDAEYRVELALALFGSCRFEESGEEARRALSADPASADAEHMQALLLERQGDLAGADRHFARATTLDGDRFGAPCRVSAEEFGRRLEHARSQLPATFREHLEGVGLIVEDLPAESLLFEESPPLDPGLLGLFAGVPLEQQGYLSAGGELPPRIYLFKRNLERFTTGPDDLAEQIAVTLYHELGHYLGMEEGDLEELDFG